MSIRLSIELTRSMVPYDSSMRLDYLNHRPIEVEAISGSCSMVRRDVMEQLDYWDEGYFLHCEDLDLCMRVRQKGWKILFVPSAPVIHHQGYCSRTRPIFAEWNKHKGMMRFYRKFFRNQYPGALMWLVAIGVWLRFTGVALIHSILHIGRWIGFAPG